METPDSPRRRRSIGVSKALLLSFYAVFLIASLLASSASAVPLSRGSLKTTDAPHAIPDLTAQQMGSWAFGEYKEEERRKLVDETNDYGHTGANDKHDPPS